MKRKFLFSPFGKDKIRKIPALLSLGMLGAAFFASSLNVQAQFYQPVNIVSGFNEDVIAETSPAGSTTTSAVDNLNESGANFAFMSINYPGATVGLPANGLINSGSTSGLQFQLADYTENNSLRLSSNNSNGLLEFEDAVQANSIFILHTTGSDSSNFSGTIHFSDGSSQSFGNINSPDWFQLPLYGSPTTIAISGIGRVPRNGGNPDNNSSNPKLFSSVVAIDQANQNKEITGVTITKSGSGGFLNVFGVSRDYNPDDCTGTPNAGQITGVDNICGGIDFELTANGTSSGLGGLQGQWQSSTDGGDTWTDIDEAVSANLTTSISEDTSFRYSMICTHSGESDISEVFAVSVKPGNECYCEPTYSNSGDRLSSVITDGASVDINYSNSNGGTHADQAGMIIEAAPGESFTINTSYVGGSQTIGIWVDWDENGNFGDTDERIFLNYSYDANQSTILTVPSNISAGEYVMRVRGSWDDHVSNGDAFACNNKSYGSSVDFTLNIIQLEACEGTPDAGEISGMDNICAGIDFDLTADGASSGFDGLQGQWQSSTDGGDTWTDIDEAVSANLTTSISEDTSFRYSMTCTNSEESDISEVFTVSVKPATECYCDVSVSYIEQITLVDFEDIYDDEAITNGYVDNTNLTAQVQAGNEYSIELKGYTGGNYTNYFVVWIDWNQNGIFESNERYQIGSIQNSTGYDNKSAIGNIVVPEDAELGTTGMRIIKNYNSAPTNPCENPSYGQIKDYSVEVLSTENCDITGGGGLYGSGTVCNDSDDNTLDLIPYGSTAQHFAYVIKNEDGTIIDFSIDEEDAVFDFTGFEEGTYEAGMLIWNGSVQGLENGSLADGITGNCFDWNPDMATIVVESCEDEPMIYDVPTNVEASDITETTAEVSWIVPDSYALITYGEAPFSPSEDAADWENIYGGSTDLEDLEPGTTYDFYIRSMCNESFDDVSDWVNISFTTEETVMEPCEAPTDLAVDAWVPTFALVTWNGNADDYEIAWGASPYEPGDDHGQQFTTGDVNSYYIGTEGGTIYDVYVRALCEDSQSEWISTSFETEEADCQSPLDATIDNTTENSAEITWSPANEGDDTWEISLTTGGQSADQGIIATVSDTPSYLAEGLESATTYSVYLRTICSDDESGEWAYNGDFTTDETTEVYDCEDLEANIGDVCYDNEGNQGVVTEDCDCYVVPVEECEVPFSEENDIFISMIHIDGIGLDVDNDYYDLNYTSSSKSAGGYAMIDSPEFTIYPNYNGSYSVSSGPAGNNNAYYYSVWIDSNGDGCFDENEQVIWSDGAITNNQMGTEDVPAYFSALAPGTYTARIRNSMQTWPNAEGDGDGEALDFVVHIVSEDEAEHMLGIDNQVFNDFSFYPNPVQHQLNLNAGTIIEQVEIFNLLGQKVISAQPNTLQTVIDTDRLQSGVYMMNVTINGSQKTYKIVKK